MPGTTVERVARARSYLMCAPDHFAVDYAINPWMDPDRPVDAALARSQWFGLRDVLRRLGHSVELAPPSPGLPDMVFTANAATVIDGRVLVATFRHRERAGESYVFEQWFRWRGYRPVRRARGANEGEGDHLLVDGLILAGHGLRTDPDSHPETSDYFGRPVVGLTLVDPRYYHLDTALAVLGGREIMYYPGAFSGASLDRLRALFPDAIEADAEDAAVFGLNAISDGYHVVLPAAASRLAERLKQRGFAPVAVELGELLKAGGGPKCCVLELRAAPSGRATEPVWDAA
jgi:N-dimethylarginine dimethylaminohydrolase